MSSVFTWNPSLSLSPHPHPQYVCPGQATLAGSVTPSELVAAFCESGFRPGSTFIPEKAARGEGHSESGADRALCPGFGLPLLARPARALFAGLCWVTRESLVPRGDGDHVWTLLVLPLLSFLSVSP